MASAERQMPVHVEAALQGGGRQYNLSEQTAVDGDKLRPAGICGNFRNLGSVLSANRFCTKFAWNSGDRHVFYPLVHDIHIPARD